jgi:glycosyltransferase involved in cell wall biosynthesis
MNITNEKPFFSIVTCSLNSSKYISKNIESVKKQIFGNYEHLFIDGYSKDNTRSLIKKYEAIQPSRVKLYKKKPLGISDAMNEGVKRAKGRYLIHLHSDDCFHDKYVLQYIYKFLSKNNFPDWIYGKIQVVEEWGGKVGTFPNERIFQTSNSFLLKYFNFVPHQAVFIKNQTFRKFGFFDNTLSSSMDYDLWLRIANKTRWIFVNRIISNYAIRKGARSSAKKNENINNLERYRVAKKRLNKIDYLLFRLVKIPVDIYNQVLR